jgi:hypothetical protein
MPISAINLIFKNNNVHDFLRLKFSPEGMGTNFSPKGMGPWDLLIYMLVETETWAWPKSCMLYGMA